MFAINQSIYEKLQIVFIRIIFIANWQIRNNFSLGVATTNYTFFLVLHSQNIFLYAELTELSV